MRLSQEVVGILKYAIGKDNFANITLRRFPDQDTDSLYVSWSEMIAGQREYLSREVDVPRTASYRISDAEKKRNFLVSFGTGIQSDAATCHLVSLMKEDDVLYLETAFYGADDDNNDVRSGSVMARLMRETPTGRDKTVYAGVIAVPRLSAITYN